MDAVCTISNDLYVDGTIVTLKSFLDHNKWFIGDIIVFHSDNFSKLSETNKQKINSISDKIILKKVDENEYESLYNKLIKVNGTHQKFLPSMFTFDAFNLKEYKSVLYIDSDLLFLNSIEDMYKKSSNFIVTPNDTKGTNDSFNGGVFLLKDDMLNQDFKNKLIKFGSTSNNFQLLDQTIMNDFFAKTEKTYVSYLFNYSKRYCPDSKFSQNILKDVKIIHYVSEKPWSVNKKEEREKNYSKLEKLWTNYFKLIK